MTGTLNAQLTSSVPVPPAGIGVSSLTRTSVVVLQRSRRLSTLISRPLARIRLTVTPPVMAALGLDRAVFGAKRFWSSRMASSFSAESLGLVIVTISRPETVPVTGSSRVSIE